MLLINNLQGSYYFPLFQTYACRVGGVKKKLPIDNINKHNTSDLFVIYLNVISVVKKGKIVCWVIISLSTTL